MSRPPKHGAELRHDFVKATRPSVPSEGRAALLELFAEELLCLLQLAHRLQQAGQAVHAAHRVRVGVAKLRPASAPAVRGIERGMCVLPTYRSTQSPGLVLQYINHFPSCIWRQNSLQSGGAGGAIQSLRQSPQLPKLKGMACFDTTIQLAEPTLLVLVQAQHGPPETKFSYHNSCKTPIEVSVCGCSSPSLALPRGLISCDAYCIASIHHDRLQTLSISLRSYSYHMLGIARIEAPGSDGLRPQPHMRSSCTPSRKGTVS